MIQDYIDAGRIVNTHGVRGEVKIEVWLDSPEMLAACRRVFIGDAERRILASRVHQGFLIAALEGIGDMNAAMALKGRTVRISAGMPDSRRGATSCRICWGPPSEMRTARLSER